MEKIVELTTIGTSALALASASPHVLAQTETKAPNTGTMISALVFATGSSQSTKNTSGM